MGRSPHLPKVKPTNILAEKPGRKILPMTTRKLRLPFCLYLHHVNTSGSEPLQTRRVPQRHDWASQPSEPVAVVAARDRRVADPPDDKIIYQKVRPRHTTPVGLVPPPTLLLFAILLDLLVILVKYNVSYLVRGVFCHKAYSCCLGNNSRPRFLFLALYIQNDGT